MDFSKLFFGVFAKMWDTLTLQCLIWLSNDFIVSHGRLLDKRVKASFRPKKKNKGKANIVSVVKFVYNAGKTGYFFFLTKIANFCTF